MNRRIILIFSFFLLITFIGCKKEIDPNLLTKDVWYDLDWSISDNISFEGLNEIFFEVEEDTIILYELFSFGLPATFVSYKMIGKESSRNYLFYCAEFQKYLSLEITPDTNLIIKRPLLNDSDNTNIELLYIKENVDRSEVRKEFFNSKEFMFSQKQRQEKIINNLAHEYHEILYKRYLK